ncbi:TPA: hypothetical protein I9Z65_001481 [Clostridium perfringens]|uniref:hypothetical protein n=1 Tax=Clostridium perfringens TaxID=1502 RepID=UPI001B81E942|nr:hypothetical protein [Clostridium perfringens]HBC2033282.1 hypothetical protein [Clostridium perfringens]HBC2056689.1 hypothetical protein [Clostridium perfringens]HBC2070809.1 hypothetical protein [Clostridium perfringens]
MFNKNDIENLKNDLEQLLGKTITYRYNCTKLKSGREEQEYEGIIESISTDTVILRKLINENIGVIESYKLIDILSGIVKIIDVK